MNNGFIYNLVKSIIDKHPKSLQYFMESKDLLVQLQRQLIYRSKEEIFAMLQTCYLSQ